jgi:hypothetical protein
MICFFTIEKGVPISPVRILQGLLLTLIVKASANILDHFEICKVILNYFFQFKQSIWRSTSNAIDILQTKPLA